MTNAIVLSQPGGGYFTPAAPSGFNGTDFELQYRARADKRDNTIRGVIQCHGADCGALVGSDSGGSTFTLLQAITAAGWSPMNPDLGSDGTTARPNAWGNGAAVNALGTAYTFVTGAATNYHAVNVPAAKTSGGVIVIGISMGAQTALNWAARNPTLCKAILLIAPLLDADYLYTNTVSRDAEMDIAYGNLAPLTPTITGTAGATNYNYKTVIRYLLPGGGTIDSVPSAASGTFAGPLQASLGASPSTVTVTATPTPANNPLHGTEQTVVILRSVAAGAYTNIGSVSYGTTTFSDNVTGAGSAYTVTPSTAWSWNGSNYPAGANSGPSWNPTKYVPAALKAIPCQAWWSANDGKVNQTTTPGTTPGVVSTYATAYGANFTAYEIVGDPVHLSAVAGVAGNAASMATVLSLFTANA